LLRRGYGRRKRIVNRGVREKLGLGIAAREKIKISELKLG
jgi:hypothetical protein